MKELVEIQKELKAPKNQYNLFGKYKYRSCEDILEALKPLLNKKNCVLFISDEVKQVGSYTFIEAKAVIRNTSNESIYSTAQAGLQETKKGMDIAQIYGASSSYARKYALNGLFLIDDTKDADTLPNDKPKEVAKKDFTSGNFEAAAKANASPDTIRKKYNLSKEVEEKYIEYVTTH